MSTVDPDSKTFCPYVGLSPFKASHSDYFFGRNFDSCDIADHFLARPITVLYGKSGVGKSSVLNVGLPRAMVEIGVKERLHIFRDWFGTERAMAWLEKQAADDDERLFLILDQFEEFFLYHNQDQVDAFAHALRRLLRQPGTGVHVLISLRQDAL